MYNYKYDINNNRIEYILTINGIVDFWWTRKYNSNNDEIQYTRYDPETGLITQRVKTDRDSNGNAILRTTYEYTSTTASKIVPSEILDEPCLHNPFEKDFEKLESTKCEENSFDW